jgi:hypothetical protein
VFLPPRCVPTFPRTADEHHGSTAATSDITALAGHGGAEPSTRAVRKLSDADEGAPDGRKTGADKKVVRVFAKHIAVSAHINADAPDLMMTGGIK